MREQKQKLSNSPEIRCKNCGSQEFATQPNQYDVYEVVDGELTYVRSHHLDNEVQLYCRDCSEILEDAEAYSFL